MQTQVNESAFCHFSSFKIYTIMQQDISHTVRCEI